MSKGKAYEIFKNHFGSILYLVFRASVFRLILFCSFFPGGLEVEKQKSSNEKEEFYFFTKLILGGE